MRFLLRVGCVVLLLLPGCAHSETSGVLSVGVIGGGGTSVSDSYSPVTFGSYVPCVQNGAAEVKITKVGYREHNLAPAANVKVFKRVVSGDKMESTIGTARGMLPNLKDTDLSGEISEDVEGTIVTQSCEEKDSQNFTEILFSIESGQGGTHVTEVYFEYELHGKSYVLEVPHELVFCGEKTKEHDMCRD
ncbi:hypothetical protein FIU87_02520 [Bacillus sp. THAF10]|uniref:hypothetical protein n=1 Tax=Bacillus sp. THAF10 TaxID=2587848 RepID=UPI0012685525|nr:hypothetical protein [Bacillus sp. THAF10]QFT87514.1 hypothetical protein FIU87_02520 [Bacillus sp. THAF10]